MSNVSFKLAALLFILTRSLFAQENSAVEIWISSEDLSHRLTRLPDSEIERSEPNTSPRRNQSAALTIDPNATAQTILGLGSSLEHTTCANLARLPENERRETTRRIVNPVSGIGMNLMRICMGTPDFTGEDWYSYNDTPDGAPDPELTHFSIDRDRAYVLPALRMALEENPDLLFYASPWSPPGWMTTTGDMIGGKLKREYYSVYADYFVRFVQAYAAEGIPIHAVTIQNEPGVDRSKESDPKWKYPSCRWSGEDERDFIRDHLGPAFERAGLETEIWTYDHNFNTRATPDGDDPGIDYPTVVLNDAQAAQYVDGVAFHGYAGRPEGMTIFAERFPEVPLYFTEGSAFGGRGARKIVSYFANGASSYNAWVTMIDEHGGPNNGPFEASRTSITLEAGGTRVDYHFDYYMYGQFMKFIQRGAKRLKFPEGITTQDAIAFQNPDGALLAITINTGTEAETQKVAFPTGTVEFTMPPKSIATVRLPATN